jgi:hypothetical protein
MCQKCNTTRNHPHATQITNRWGINNTDIHKGCKVGAQVRAKHPIVSKE